MFGSRIFTIVSKIKYDTKTKAKLIEVCSKKIS